MSDAAVRYIRHRAKQLRLRADDPRQVGTEDVKHEQRACARQLEIVADEIAADFHISDVEP